MKNNNDKLNIESTKTTYTQPQQEEWEKLYKKWFIKTMEDCAMYKLPYSGIKGLLSGKTGGFAGFIFLEETIKQLIRRLLKAERERVINEIRYKIPNPCDKCEKKFVKALKNIL